MNVYRVPVVPLLSQRDFAAEVHAMKKTLSDGDRIAISFMAANPERLRREYPALAEIVDDAVRHDEAVRRAARALCPSIGTVRLFSDASSADSKPDNTAFRP